jgi:uncharacterized membrane protein YfcA
MLSPETTLIILTAVAAAVAAFVQGLLGFGFGITAMALLAVLLVDMECASAVISLDALAVVAVLFLLTRSDGRIHWRKVAVLVAGIALGMPAGYWFLAAFKDRALFRIVAGLVMAGFGLFGLRSIRVTRPLSAAWGLLLGVLGGCVSGSLVSGGPPLVVYLYSQDRNAHTMKRSLQVVFLAGLVIRIITMGTMGSVRQTDVLTAAAVSLPMALVFLGAGHLAARRMNPTLFRKAAFGFILAMGIATALRALLAHG